MFAYTRFYVRLAEGRHPPLGEFVTVGGIKTHVVHRGRDHEHTVVMLHGLNGVARDFTGALLDRLSERYEIVLPDRPGYGFTERRGRHAARLGEQVAWLDGLLEQLGVEDALLVGHSMGAALAVRYAIERRERVRGLVLVAPYLYPGDAKPERWSWLSRVPGLRWAVAQLFLVPVGRPLSRWIAGKSFEPEAMPVGYVRLWADSSLRPSQFLTLLDEIAVLDEGVGASVGAFGSLDVPVFVLAGDEDGIVDSREHAARFCEEAPNAWLSVLEGVGHAIVWTRPESVIEAVDEVHHVAARPGSGNGRGGSV